jgi:hypothetical protein
MSPFLCPGDIASVLTSVNVFLMATSNYFTGELSPADRADVRQRKFRPLNLVYPLDKVICDGYGGCLIVPEIKKGTPKGSLVTSYLFALR